MLIDEEFMVIDDGFHMSPNRTPTALQFQKTTSENKVY